MNDIQPAKPVFVSRRMEQQWIRMQGVKMMRDGSTAREVGEHFGVTQRTVYGWVAQFNEGGQSALLARTGAGRPPKLSADHLRWIAATVRDNTPDQLKFAFGLWTLRLIGELIARELNVRLSLPTLGKVMAQLGFSAQRPLRRAWEQDATLVQRWVEEDLPRLRERAKRLGARIFFADEASMRSDYHAGTTWAPRGHTPIVRATGGRWSVNMISAVGAGGEFKFMLVDGTTDAQVFLRFLKQLMMGARKPIFLVLDNHSIHRAKMVRDYVQSTNGKLELHYIPPYSPQLNPDEQVWKNVKERVAKKLPRDKHELRSLLTQALERLQAMPEIVRGFFRHPECGFMN